MRWSGVLNTGGPGWMLGIRIKIIVMPYLCIVLLGWQSTFAFLTWVGSHGEPWEGGNADVETEAQGGEVPQFPQGDLARTTSRMRPSVLHLILFKWGKYLKLPTKYFPSTIFIGVVAWGSHISKYWPSLLALYFLSFLPQIPTHSDSSDQHSRWLPAWCRREKEREHSQLSISKIDIRNSSQKQ